MTGPEHYREAERLITEARKYGSSFHAGSDPSVRRDTAEAQVHAMLALAAATGATSDGREWQDVAGSKLSG